jgi:preprotein translocase subunit SecE
MMMKKTKNSAMNFKEIILWLAIALVTILAFFATYYFDFSGPIKALIWIGWFVLTGLLGFFTSLGKRVFEFGKEAKVEMQKVVWPTRQETVQTTSIVMIMVAVTGFILWGVDSGMMWLIGKLTRLG